MYIGRIEALNPIHGADFIESATANCHQGGKWRGIIKKGSIPLGRPCIVYLPDSILPKTPGMEFMEATNWRVKMRSFKSTPSEALIMPYNGFSAAGDDVTLESGVNKYIKAIPEKLQGEIKGPFPAFVPKTDEPNWQSSEDLVNKLIGHPYVISEKADGSSTTAYKYQGEFGVCSRNWEVTESETNAYWKVALQHNLKENLPEGYAIQWETCGPQINGNNLGYTKLAGLAFNVWDINARKPLSYYEFVRFCSSIEMPRVKTMEIEDNFQPCNLNARAQGKYINNLRNIEGIVIRSQEEIDGQIVSFKVLNLDYKD